MPNWHRGSFPGIKLLGHKADPSPSSSAKVKKEHSYISTPSTCLDVVDRNNFTLTFICQ